MKKNGTFPFGGIAGYISTANENGITQVIIDNCLNLGKSSRGNNRGEIIGYTYGSQMVELKNNYYTNTNLNKVIGAGSITSSENVGNATIDTKLITSLNTYVTNFNIENAAKPNEDATKVDYVLKEWDIKDGKLIFK